MKQDGKIHAAPVKSARLQAMLEMLRRAGAHGVSGQEYTRETGFLAVNTVVSELRAHGYVVDCTPSERTARGWRVYRYVLRAEPGQGQLFPTSTHRPGAAASG